MNDETPEYEVQEVQTAITYYRKIQHDDTALPSLLEYASGMIGYCQALKAGTVITDRYIHGLNDYYIPNMRKIRNMIVKLIDSDTQRKSQNLNTSPEHVQKNGNIEHIEGQARDAGEYWISTNALSEKALFYSFPNKENAKKVEQISYWTKDSIHLDRILAKI